MNNQNTLILGQTGSGKTSLAKRLLALTPRALILDPQDDYHDVEAFTTFREAADFYVAEHSHDFHLLYQGDIAHWEAWLDMVFRTQQLYNDPPIGLFLDESSLYSSSGSIDDILERVYTQGRRHRINVVTITQRDTQINPIIRANSQVWVSMRQRKLSRDVREIFTPEELDKIGSLQPYTPFIEALPEEGVHYLVDPPGFDIFGNWQRLLTEHHQGGSHEKES